MRAHDEHEHFCERWHYLPRAVHDTRYFQFYLATADVACNSLDRVSSATLNTGEVGVEFGAKSLALRVQGSSLVADNALLNWVI